MFLLVLLNSTAQGKAGKVENWIFAPINISSMSTSLGNTDAQNQDLSFSKGEGQVILYKIVN
ncbi:MAG: hypothetical protein FWC64_07030 [Treponema sp.]|nr:hypothetical protein [Treponema sp.]